VLQVTLLAAALFGSYHLVVFLLETTRVHNAVSPPATSAPHTVQPTAVTHSKLAPLVGGDLVGAELYLPDAAYPADSNQVQDGNVTVNVRVSSKGIVVSAKAVEGDEHLRAAAEKAAKSAAFSPDKLRGKGSVINGTITYDFVTPGNPASANQTLTAAESLAQSGVSATTGGPLAGAELELVQPDYPSSAKRQKIAGAVTIVVRVSRKGKVLSWRALDGDQRLRASAVKAARRSTFSPDKLPGTGEVVGTISYTFR
jgi:TonB family protein